MSDPYHWKAGIGDNWAREHRRTDRSFAGLTRVLVDRACAVSPRRMLDVGCGAGQSAILVGKRLGEAQIVGIDLSESLIATARRRSGSLENVQFRMDDASSWRDPTFVPDTLLSRHGVMFFEDPVKAFANLRNGSAPAAKLIFSCFRDRACNTWATEVSKIVGRDALTDVMAPGPFAFADDVHVKGLLGAAGWEEVAFEAVDWEYVAGAGDDPIYDAIAFFRKIGPAASALANLEGDQLDTALAALADVAAQNFKNGQVAFRASAWIVTARAG